MKGIKTSSETLLSLPLNIEHEVGTRVLLKSTFSSAGWTLKFNEIMLNVAHVHVSCMYCWGLSMTVASHGWRELWQRLEKVSDGVSRPCKSFLPAHFLCPQWIQQVIWWAWRRTSPSVHFHKQKWDFVVIHKNKQRDIKNTLKYASRNVKNL